MNTTSQTTAVRKALDFGELPPEEWFANPELPMLTPLTVTREGRIFGHLAGWGTAHRGLAGRIMPPRSRTNYARFQNKTAVVAGADGEPRMIPAANLTMDTKHAPMSAGLADASSHYDHSGTIIAQVAVFEDEHGIAYSGAVLPDVTPAQIRRALSCAGSGDWRRYDPTNSLELCAALLVPCEGFEQAVPHARVASGAPMALVAAGMVQPAPATFGRRVDPSWSKPEPIQSLAVGKLTGMSNPSHPYATVSATGDLHYYGKVTPTPAVEGAPSPATLAAQIDRAIEQRERKAALAAQRESLLAEVDDTAARHAALVASLDDTAARKAALLAELDGEPFDVSSMPEQLKREWLNGEIAARIAYGTPGQFDRCRAIAREKGVPGKSIDGMCANLIREKTGKNPGDHGGDE